MNLVNAAFEAVGAVLAWENVRCALLEAPRGVSVLMVAFSAAWAVACVPYYLSHGDRLSTVGAAVRCLGCATWTVIALRGAL